MCVSVRVCMKSEKIGTGTVVFFVLVTTCFFWRCFPLLSLVLCKYLCNYALYL